MGDAAHVVSHHPMPATASSGLTPWSQMGIVDFASWVREIVQSSRREATCTPGP
jgi:hypothetical protein